MRAARQLLLAVGLLLLAFAAEAQQMATVFGPNVVAIRRNTFEYGPVSISAGTTALTVTISRENWPAGGVDIELLVSFDGGNTFLSPGPSHIDGFIPTPKEPNVLDSPASIGVGWNQEIRQATHVKARTINPSPNFQATVKIEALVVQ